MAETCASRSPPCLSKASQHSKSSLERLGSCVCVVLSFTERETVAQVMERCQKRDGNAPSPSSIRQIITQVIRQVMERCQKRAEAKQSDEDYDEEEEEVQAEAAERDDELLDALTG